MRCVMTRYELMRTILNENLFEPKAVRFNAPLILTHAFSLMYVNNSSARHYFKRN